MSGLSYAISGSSVHVLCSLEHLIDEDDVVHTPTKYHVNISPVGTLLPRFADRLTYVVVECSEGCFGTAARSEQTLDAAYLDLVTEGWRAGHEALLPNRP